MYFAIAWLPVVHIENVRTIRIVAHLAGISSRPTGQKLYWRCIMPPLPVLTNAAPHLYNVLALHPQTKPFADIKDWSAALFRDARRRGAAGRCAVQHPHRFVLTFRSHFCYRPHCECECTDHVCFLDSVWLLILYIPRALGNLNFGLSPGHTPRQRFDATLRCR